MIYARLMVALAALVAAFSIGWLCNGVRLEKKALEREQEARAAVDAANARADAAAAKYEHEKSGRADAQREIVRTVTRVVDRPVYRNVCIDADGLQLIARAAGAGAGAASEPEGSVPASAPAR